MPKTYEVVILGSGPAGLTAAIYTGRANLSPLVLEGEPSSASDQPGGQLMLTTEVENFPGFPEGVQGPELMDRMRNQAIKFGASVEQKKAFRVSFDQKPYKIWTSLDETDIIYANSVIIATGAKSLMLDIPGEQELVGHGVSTCATCDGFFFRDKTIAVIGGGDSALEEALFLTRFANKVYLIHRRNEWRASPIMQERARSNVKIVPIWNTKVTSVNGASTVKSLSLLNTETNETTELELDGVFIAIGHSPSTEVFKGIIDMDENGYIETGVGTQTNIEGVFACGDVQDHTYKQAITAAGSGCMAALDVQKYIENLVET